MFKNLTDFKYKRTAKEAFGFYLAYLLLIIIVGALVGGILGLVIGEASIEFGMRMGGFVAVIISLSLSFAILSRKKMTNDFGMMLVALLSGILSFIGGGLLGLIPAAYLSTK